MEYRGVLILTRSEVAELMDLSDYMHAVENAFLLPASGGIPGPGVLDIPAERGMFHVKGSSMLAGGRIYVAVKVNGNFPENKSRFELPTIQGAILLCDGIHGYPLAVLDSVEITTCRTAAATAIAAKRLARSDSRTATMCGCGVQGKIQLLALTNVLPLTRAFAFDRDESVAAAFSREMTQKSGIPVIAVRRPEEGTRQSDVIVTCTTSRRFFLKRDHVPRGAFVAAVGADSHDKQEIDPALMASSKVVTDITSQCERIGDLHHAIEAKVMTRGDVYAELHDIVSGARPGRVADEEIVVFDSTGTALQDVAAAAVAYQRAVERGIGKFVNLIGS